MIMKDVEDGVVGRKVHHSFLPDAYYDQDTGGILYAVMLPVELPYRFSQTLKDCYYHFRKLDHQHE